MPGAKTYAELTFSGLLLLAYLLGSIPWGLILSRIFARDDIRLKGSGNIGATNVARETGVIPGLLTLAGDILKGAVPVYLALLAFRDGGKGVATAAGCFAVVSPAAVLAAFGVFIAMLLVTRRVSVASLSAAATLPVAVWIAADSAIMTAAAAIVALFIFIRHGENLKRLLAGKEAEFKLKKDRS
jgi:glycerol-3-phosphate acyltransferase PlsY